MTDRTFTFKPSVPFYPTLKPTWKIDNEIIPATGNGVLNLTKEVHIPVDAARVTKSVQVDYEVVTIAADQELRLKTYGKDGNYALKVSLSYSFDDNKPQVLFRAKDHLVVQGQVVAGDPAYNDYLSCLENYRSNFLKYWYVPEVIIRPGSPIEDIVRFEGSLLSLSRVFSQEGPGDRIRTKETD